MQEHIHTCDCTILHEDSVKYVKDNFLDETAFDQLSLFFKVFADPTRLKIIYALDQKELCVCDIAAVLGMTKSAVSHQLALLKQSDLVKYRREGKTVFYSLEDDHICKIFESGLEHINE